MNLDGAGEVPPQTAAMSVKLPQFWGSCPEAWFIQAEAQFNISRITSDETRYAYVVAALPPDTINTIMDIIRDPPTQDKYQALKHSLIQRHSVSEERRLEELLSNAELGGRRPSEFYRHLQNLAGSSGTVGEKLLLKLWLRKLPSAINITLVACGKTNVLEMQELADKIWEVSNNPQISAFRDNFTSNPNNSVNSNRTSVENPLTFLTGEISKMTTEMSGFKETVSRMVTEMHGLKESISQLVHILKRNSNRQRSQSKSSERRSHTPSNNTVCFYHNKYGERAHKCLKPCSYSSAITSPSALN